MRTLLILFAATLLAQQSQSPNITYNDLLRGLDRPSSWLTYSGDYTGRRHSPLTQITPENVKRLSAQWTFQSETLAPGRGFEGTPLLIDGVLYLTGSNNFAWAIDARTGRSMWRYRRGFPSGLTSGSVYPGNRGFAILGDRLFMVSLGAHLLSRGIKDGDCVWDRAMEDYLRG